jgi:hypothetical protein
MEKIPKLPVHGSVFMSADGGGGGEAVCVGGLCMCESGASLLCVTFSSDGKVK